MKKRSFLKLLLLLPLLNLYAKRERRTYKDSTQKLFRCSSSQRLSISAKRKKSSFLLTLISGEVAISHTKLHAGDVLTIPRCKALELVVINSAHFSIREIHHSYKI